MMVILEDDNDDVKCLKIYFLKTDKNEDWTKRTPKMRKRRRKKSRRKTRYETSINNCRPAKEVGHSPKSLSSTDSVPFLTRAPFAPFAPVVVQSCMKVGHELVGWWAVRGVEEHGHFGQKPTEGYLHFPFRHTSRQIWLTADYLKFNNNS